jgi:hypothetical protein
MDMAPAFGHRTMLRAKRSDRQRERIGGGAISAHFFEISRAASPDLVTPTVTSFRTQVIDQKELFVVIGPYIPSKVPSGV